jgi:hypothetical protein
MIAALPKENTNRDRIVIITQGRGVKGIASSD